MKTTILMLTIVILILSLTLGFLIFKLEYKPSKLPEETAIQLAQTLTILRPSFTDVKTIDNFLKGTKLAGLGWAYVYAEQQSGIGADVLLAISIHESGWGSGTYVQSPYNNLFSWGVTDSGVTKDAYFTSKSDCIIKVAEYLKKLYLTKGGAYYSGETLSAINKYYASDKYWASKVLGFLNDFQKTLSEKTRAKIWSMETGIIKGNLPPPLFFTEGYWTQEREDVAIYLYRINGR